MLLLCIALYVLLITVFISNLYKCTSKRKVYRGRIFKEEERENERERERERVGLVGLYQ